MTHLLSTRELTLVSSWKQWKDGWDGETDADALLGRLHAGFKLYLDPLPRAEYLDVEAQRMCLYLDLADSYGAIYPTTEEGWVQYRSTKRSPEKVWEDIARQAMQILVRKVLNRDQSTNREWELPPWATVMLRPEVFEKVLWFFRSVQPISHGQICEIRNLSGSYSVKESAEGLRVFARRFCHFVWVPGLHQLVLEDRERSRIERMLNAAKPVVLEIQTFLDDLDFLLHDSVYQQVDPELLSVLTDLALRKPYPQYRERYADLDEALMGDTRAPRILLVLQKKLAGRSRQTQK